MTGKVTKGSCLCGAVAFDLHGPLRPVYACHCKQCRKTSGHFWAATSVPDEALTFTRDEGLRWFRSSENTKRGFCGTCGSSLFWVPEGERRTVVAAGALEGELELQTKAHVFMCDKGSYYEIGDGLPQFEEFKGDENA
ncbi:glutathione-dependent formaldehyde-activating, GFA [Roseobacter sp. SK209-2-6]|uniref:GFA family protein n=1 Tax=Roseobacter sp. SK209-2-6 TaxID=388739 RepID=UPI0000F3FD78|nr:GFA family protein [Roseobacter sp. SK209-2-6]EBA14307.1 glutathione-dependent formaldehyde-activating, GFA [Roseobacter sp. SK209-2-6]